MNHSSTDLVYMALGAVLIALCSWITVPAAVPFTMQTFAVFFILSALGGKRGTVTILVYIALGAAGVPVFSQFGAGPGVLLGNTGGYILGFLAMGLTYWGITALLGETRKIRFLGLLLGLVVLYAFGTAWFLLLYTSGQGNMGILPVLGWCVFPFVIPDLVKLGLALALERRLGKSLSLQ